jgi:hypothetical protein
MIYPLRVCLLGVLLACAGLVLAFPQDARCDPVQEEIDAARESIIRSVRDDVQRRTRRTKEIAPNNVNYLKSRRARSSFSKKKHE